MDTTKLKRMAERGSFGCQIVHIGGDDCKAILALIAENERLIEENHIRFEQALVNGSDAATYKHQRDEAVALLMEWCSVGSPIERGSCHSKTDAFLARIDTE